MYTFMYLSCTLLLIIKFDYLSKTYLVLACMVWRSDLEDGFFWCCLVMIAIRRPQWHTICCFLTTPISGILLSSDQWMIGRVEFLGSLPKGKHSRSYLFIMCLVLSLAFPYIERAFGETRPLQEC